MSNVGSVIEWKWELKVHLWEIMTNKFYSLQELFEDFVFF
jgi:hypothetical protein